MISLSQWEAPLCPKCWGKRANVECMLRDIPDKISKSFSWRYDYLSLDDLAMTQCQWKTIVESWNLCTKQTVFEQRLVQSSQSLHSRKLSITPFHRFFGPLPWISDYSEKPVLWRSHTLRKFKVCTSLEGSHSDFGTFVQQCFLRACQGPCFHHLKVWFLLCANWSRIWSVQRMGLAHHRSRARKHVKLQCGDAELVWSPASTNLNDAHPIQYPWISPAGALQPRLMKIHGNYVPIHFRFQIWCCVTQSGQVQKVEIKSLRRSCLIRKTLKSQDAISCQQTAFGWLEMKTQDWFTDCTAFVPCWRQKYLHHFLKCQWAGHFWPTSCVLGKETAAKPIDLFYSLFFIFIAVIMVSKLPWEPQRACCLKIFCSTQWQETSGITLQMSGSCVPRVLVEREISACSQGLCPQRRIFPLMGVVLSG